MDQKRRIERVTAGLSEIAPAIRTDPTEDDPMPNTLVRLCMMFPETGATMIKDCNAMRRRGIHWNVIEGNIVQQIKDQDPAGWLDIMAKLYPEDE
jgi:hypothetical protein